MDKQKSFQNKLGKVLETTSKGLKRIQEAVEQHRDNSSGLVCLKDGVLDYELIEEDVKQIHKNIQTEGDKVLGSHLILDDKSDTMEIRTYTEKNGETFLSQVQVTVKTITNIPEDIFEELNKNGLVELSLKI